MSFSPTGWNAIFKPYRVEPVVGWNALGRPLVVDAATGRRVDVHDSAAEDEFCNLERADQPFIGTLPGDGWTINWADGTADPVIGFAVQADGCVRPILAELGGQASAYYADGGEPTARLVPPKTVE